MDIQMQHFGRLLRGFYPHLIISNQFSNDTKLNSLYPLCERDVFFHQPFLEGKSMRKIIFSVCATALCLSVCAGSAAAAYMKMDPPPDADKAFLAGNNSCWLATAANMLAGAGYGVGATVQARANNIYANLTAHYGTANGGWADTALTWWLSSAHNTWPANPYDVVTVYGNKTKTPWANANGARFIGNELRRCQMLGLSISWPRTSAGGSAYGGHAIACWGDSGGNAVLAGNPAQVIVVDSDRDTGGNVQTYTYDVYNNPNPAGFDEGNGWYINYSANHPFIKHIVTLCPTDNPGDHTLTQKVTGSYRIHQRSRFLRATDLHYKVGTDVDILSYRTWIDWNTANKPDIVENAKPPRELSVEWDLRDNPVPYCTWVTITTEFVLPYWNAIWYRDVMFTYPDLFIRFPEFRWELFTPTLQLPAMPSNACGGYVIGSFELINPEGTGKGPEVVGEYRFMHEYDFMQNPEFHEFMLESGEKEPYMIGNLRFGHSYGQLDPDELWAFKNWMTRIPQQFNLNQVPVVKLEWEGLLPYPEGEIYQGQEEPPPCTVFFPEDLNRDCCVNLEDFAMLARRWMECTYDMTRPN